MHSSLRVAAITASLLTAATAQILPHGYVVETLAPTQHGPISLDLLPDGRVLFVEQNTGAVKVLSTAAGNVVATIGSVPDLVVSYSQGLLAVAIDPAWPTRPFVYCYHTNATAADLRITRYTVAGDLTMATSSNLQLGQGYTVLLGLPDTTPQHEGGCLRFAPDGTLYCAVGDDKNSCAAQDPTVANGKLLRLRVDALPITGSGPPPRAQLVPTGNPFSGPGDLAPLVWATGLRNPFRFHIDPVDSAVFVADVGETRKDEIDRIDVPGANLGWPWFEADLPFTTCSGSVPATVLPIATQAIGPQFTALVSVGVYRAPPNAAWRFGSNYDGDYFYTEHFTGRIWRLHQQGASWPIAEPVPGQFSAELWGEGVPWIVDAKFGADGAMYFCRRVSSTGGSVGRIRPTTATANSYGQGCGGSWGIATLAAAAGSLPNLGTTFQLELTGLAQPPAGISFGLLGFSKTSWAGVPLPADLSVIGMPGCQALLALGTAALLTNTGTTANWPVPLPATPGLVGQDFYAQALVLDPGRNAFGAVVSNGVECVIR